MATISQINGNEVAGKEFYDYVRTEGAVLFSFNPDFSPAALYGGSWEKITGRFLIGAGGSYALGSTGGEANVTLTVNQMPSHEHNFTTAMQSWGHLRQDGDQLIWIIGTKNQQGLTYTGGNQPHNNMPPYIGCNIWRKIA